MTDIRDKQRIQLGTSQRESGGVLSRRRSLSKLLAKTVGAGALFLTLSGIPVLGQHYTFQQYGQAEGLHNLNVTSLLQDRTGFLWAGTENGLYQYDGARFLPVHTVEGVDDHDITALHQDARGRIWISTLHDLLYSEHGTFSQVTRTQKIQARLHSAITSFPEDPNHIYLLDNNSISVAESLDEGKSWSLRPLFSPQQLAEHPDLRKTSGLLAGPKQELWFGCGSSLCIFSRDGIRVLSSSRGLPEDRWTPALKDGQGSIWIRGLHHIASCTESGCSLREYNLTPLLTGAKTGLLGQDQSGRILANLASGVAILEGKTWTVLGPSNGLPEFPIGTVFVDHQGAPWFALAGHGLLRWRGYGTWESYTTAEGLLDNLIWGIYQNGRGLWVGTQRDLQVLPNGSHRFQHRPDRNPRALSAVQTITADKNGHLWGGQEDGDLIDYDPGKQLSRVVTNLQSIIFLLSDRNNHLWICTNVGLYSLDLARAPKGKPVLETAIPPVRVYKAVEDPKGGLWFMSNAGLFHLENQHWTKIPLPEAFHPQFAEHVAIQNDGSFWINGVEPYTLLHGRMNGSSFQELEQIHSAHLASAEVVELAIDSRGWIWVGSDAGIDIFNGKQWRRVTESDGLIWNDIDGASFFEAPDHTIWIGTSGGLAHVLKPENLFQPQSLTAWITDAHFGDLSFRQAGSNVQLPWAKVPLSFHLAASDLAEGSSILFRYRLVNVEDWTYTQAHDLHYPPLAPGHYRLEVLAENTSRHESSPVTTIEFTILAPWWRTKYFYVFLGLAVTGIVLALWRWNVRLLLVRQHYLENLVSERTEELRLLATRDSLTGLLNRAAIFEQLEREIDRCQREGVTLAIALADLDHFKEINDSYGHLVGDDFLREYASRILNTVRSYDYVGRYGGEELLIIFPNLDPEVALSRLEDLRVAVAGTPFETEKVCVNVTCSFGLAWLDSSTQDSQALIEQADQALYRAKAQGRNRVEYYPAFPSSY